MIIRNIRIGIGFLKKKCLLVLLVLLCLRTSAQQDDLKLNPGNIASDTTVSFKYSDTLVIPSYYAFDLPVRMVTGHEISAITLGLYYDHGFIEIDTVIVNDDLFGHFYNITDSIFLIVWSNVNPVNIADYDTLFTLKMRSLDLSGLEETIKLTLKESSEFADSDAVEIDSVILEASEIAFRKPIPPDTNTGFSLKIGPNPFDELTTVEFNLDKESYVKFALFTPEGFKVQAWDEQAYPEGTHQFHLYGSDYAKGVYLLKFELRNSDGEAKRILKLINTR